MTVFSSTGSLVSSGPSLEDLRVVYGDLFNGALAVGPPIPGRLSIINTANRPWVVMDLAAVKRSFRPNSIREHYYSPSRRPFDSDGSKTDQLVRCHVNIAELIQSLAEDRPETLYLRVSPHTHSEHLVGLLRAQFPKTRVIVEFYDMSCLFDRPTLNSIFAADIEAVDKAILGCRAAIHLADAVVVKMGGAEFELWKKDFPVSFVSYFPSLESGAAAPTRHGTDNALGPLKILYAGSLSARELIGGTGSVPGANFVKYFDKLAEKSEFELTIVNGVHGSEAEDSSDKFFALQARYQDPPRSTYRRAMSRDILIEFAGAFDVGLCCAHYKDDVVQQVTRLGLPNRMMSYIAAGLPVVIDDRFSYAADLVREFGAGLVVPAGDFEAFSAGIILMNTTQARAGVRELRRHMLDLNASAELELGHVAEK
ncbi:MAG: hypothetical protein JJ850_04525 [Kordiimonadaceae bacterium]|nr:hypothetical protein [Kordiimonadaceae bacterium]MBO6568416.1 hypothetical protein [Kordiimonadaceae bacterium]MBO6963855.1 hypothetical protein [Kordiimonadaceae bacterium]